MRHKRRVVCVAFASAIRFAVKNAVENAIEATSANIEPTKLFHVYGHSREAPSQAKC